MSTAVVLLLVLAPPGRGQIDGGSAEGHRPDPRALVALAQQGDVASAVAAALQMPSPQVAEAARALAADATCSPRCRQAAVLLHTEARFRARYGLRRHAEPAHLHAAEVILESLTDPEDGMGHASAREFERRWRIAVGYGYQEWAGGQSAIGAFERVLERFPEDPDALVAIGAVLEQAAAAPAFVGVQRVASATWTNAAGYYERALAVRPDNVEARLRLGHVTARRGRFDAARRELQQVLAARPAPIVEALAHLFLGDVEMRQSQPGQAIEEYRAALRIEPRLQPAALALADALQAEGRGPEAAAVLLEALRSTRGQPVIGWCGYHTSLLHGYRGAMDTLWQEARP